MSETSGFSCFISDDVGYAERKHIETRLLDKLAMRLVDSIGVSKGRFEHPLMVEIVRGERRSSRFYPEQEGVEVVFELYIDPLLQETFYPKKLSVADHLDFVFREPTTLWQRIKGVIRYILKGEL